jgi:hypothetical protein
MQEASIQTFPPLFTSLFNYQFPMGILQLAPLFFSFPFPCTKSWANFTMNMTDVGFSGTHAGIWKESSPVAVAA